MAVLVPTSVLEGIFRPDLPWRIVSVIFGLALIPTLLWRRTRPLPMVAIAFGAVTVLEVARLAAGSEEPGLYTQVWFLVLTYSLFRWGSGRDALIGLSIMLVPACSSLVFDYTGLADAIGGLAILFASIALGAAVRYRTRARVRELEQVTLRGHEQLARDLHDTVAHHVSAMAISAQAGLATFSSNPTAAQEALRVIEAEASRTLVEMRAMVRYLRRNQSADFAPSPRIHDLVSLSQTDAGLPVEVQIFGNVDDVAESLSSTVYRLAQESVTNAQRHARHASRIAVHVRADEQAVRLRVSDDGDAGHAPTAASPGYGIIGMIERADLLGGTCTAGPDPGRGWTVLAVLPRDGAHA